MQLAEGFKQPGEASVPPIKGRTPEKASGSEPPINGKLEKPSEVIQNFGDSKIRVNFRQLKKINEKGFHLELEKEHGYDEIAKRVAEQVSLDDPSKIKLTAHNVFRRQPKRYYIKYEKSLADMLQTCDLTTDILYYEVLDIPLRELELLKVLHITVLYNPPTKDKVVAGYVQVRLSKQSTVEDLINEVKKKVELSNSSAVFRLLEICNFRITKIFNLDETIGNIRTERVNLRAEEIPEDEKKLGDCDHLVRVFHKDVGSKYAKFGHPFLFVIRDAEKLADVKKRIQKKLLVQDDEFTKWKFSVLKVGGSKHLHDDDIVSCHFEGTPNGGVWIPYFGLEHSSQRPNLWYFPSIY